MAPYYMIQISIAKDERREERSQAIMKALYENEKIVNITQMDGISSRIINFRVTSNHLPSLLAALDKMKIGVSYGIVDVIPIEATKPDDELKNQGKRKNMRGNSLPTELLKSGIRAQASPSFDYIAFLLIGSIIAGIGLATNNSVTIVASMLVSPLMGPLLGIVFGIVMKDMKLICTGALSEFIGIIITWGTGLLIGVVLPFLDPDSINLPQSEMTGRGEWRGLAYGLAIAIPSGIGVALSVVGNVVNSLVGVAISAALLPPIVNSGMNLTFGLIAPLWFENYEKRNIHLRISGISMLLFLLNVVVILCLGVCTLIIKRQAPVKKRGARYEGLPTIHREDVSARHLRRTSSYPPANQLWSRIKETNENEIGSLGRDTLV
mmetsp:Transcript_9291/g.13760  ORF Transcript_9291/g.13760 Transcript_9291/m.13760 type:complete len:379 (+) Transcript_9291:23-1159(+)